MNPVTTDKTGRFGPLALRTADTVPIIRYSMGSLRTDTLFRFAVGILHPPTQLAADGALVFRMPLGPYGAYNGWTPMEDGRMILADAAEYRMQLRGRDGKVLAEWQVPSEPVPVSAAGWSALVKSTTKGSIELRREALKMIQQQAGSLSQVPPPNRYVVPDKPKTLPRLNFGDGPRRLHESNGVVWVPVHLVEPPDSEFWDLIDVEQRGRITTLSLPPRQHLIHVTSLGAYVVAIDDDDLQRILLYRHKPVSSSAQRDH